MRVVADGDLGIVLVFEDAADLSKVIENLQGMLRWKAKENVPYPAAYLVAPDGTPDEVTDTYMAEAKKAVPTQLGRPGRARSGEQG